MSFDHTNPFPEGAFKFKLNGSPFDLAQKLKNKGTALKRWEIAVPARTAWEPALIRQLIKGLCAILVVLKLGISATSHRFTWYVAAPETYSSTITQTIYAVYPQAELVSRAIKPGTGYYRYPFHGARPYLFPLKAVEAFKSFDPLATWLSTMRQLRGGESCAYELTLMPIDPIHRTLGQQLLNEWTSRTDYLNAATLNTLQTKFNSRLKVVNLALKIEGATSQRANNLATSTWSTWVQYAEPGFNALAVPGPQTYQLILNAGEIGALWHPPNEYLRIPGITWTSSISLPIPEPMINLRRGLILGTNRYQGRKHLARLTHSDRDAHVTIIGITGMGKSTLLHRMIHQDIEQRKPVAAIDPHGDLITDVLKCSIPKKRAKDVIWFDTHDANCPITLNPLAVPPGIPAYLVARQALDLIKKLCADDWPGAQTERYFALALRALVDYANATLRDVPKLLNDKAFRGQVLARVTDENVKQTWVNYDRLNPGSQAKIGNPILNRLDRFYNDPILERIVCRPGSLDFRRIIDKRQIFLANLGAFQEEREANTLGALLLSQFQFAAMSRGELSKADRQRHTYYLYIDELQRFTTESLPIIYDQARKYGLSLTGAFQRLSQVAGEELKGIASGVGNIIAFATTRDDAKSLAPFMGDQVTPADLVGLSKYTALASIRLDGQALPTFTLKTQAPPPENPEAEAIMTTIRQRNHAVYGRGFSENEPTAPTAAPRQEDTNDDQEPATFFG